MLQAVPTTPLARYRWDTTQPDFVADPLQEAAAARLDVLWHTLVNPPRRAWLPSFIRRPVQPPLSGAYLWGDVGRGKSYLLDLFFDCVPGERKRRLHFHQFMLAVHEERRRLGDIADPLPRIADGWASQAQVLCFDEFQVHDIADAMLLGGLLRELLARGVYLVVTSNRRPEDLYLHGLQRARFLPTIALLKERLDVIELNGPVDYRRRALHDLRRYMSPLGADAEAGMEAAFTRLVPEHEKSAPLSVNGRPVAVRRRGSDVAWFDFEALCRTPRSAMDYLEIAERFHTVLLSGVPRLDADEYDVAHRFTNLVDVFYDRGVNLIVSAAAPPGELYRGERMAFEFQRTVSRLIEMQSAAWPGERRHS
ncbi:MAG: cell division protein ZapE [Immundisolibacter sp.]|uniref:cell division protein ZapE n=1 Tax=Immundisolibacter sp. TaxID=1934948 RepID=UPI0019A5BFA7|nr:cell division protein ZapE [Immundisolibacter sp.]MBC7161049.1 cell division protein ZapE [Immundisolibacter sp.]